MEVEDKVKEIGDEKQRPNGAWNESKFVGEKKIASHKKKTTFIDGKEMMEKG